MENISAERTGEARLQHRGIILKLRHVDVHVYHLPFLSTHSLFAIRTLSIHQKLCRDKHSPLFKLSDAKAIRLAYVIGSVQEISLKKWKSFTNPEVFQTKNKKRLFFFSLQWISMGSNVVWQYIFRRLEKICTIGMDHLNDICGVFASIFVALKLLNICSLKYIPQLFWDGGLLLHSLHSEAVKVSLSVSCSFYGYWGSSSGVVVSQLTPGS